GSFAEKIFPKVRGWSAKASGRLKFARLSRLNDSASAGRVTPSRNAKRRFSARSTVARLGPRRIFRPALPHVYWGGMAKAETLNHSCGVGWERVGLNRTFGRSTPKF